MSFFKKMKERLFKSSSKIDEGLEAIVDEAAEEIAEEIVEEVAETAPAPTPNESITAPATPQPEPAPEPAQPRKPGLLARALGSVTGAVTGTQTVKKRTLDDAMLESLEELLITADMGVETALKLSARIAEGRFGRRVSTAEIKQALAGEIATILEPVARPLPIYAKRPQVQERLTVQIGNEIKSLLQTEDVAVVIDAEHLCVSSRGIGDTSSSTVTSFYSGKFGMEETKREFLTYVYNK